MNHGGRRPGSGRKSNAAIASMRRLIDSTITEPQWQELMRELMRRAQKGNLRAAQLLLAYRFGTPTEAPSLDIDQVLDKFLHYYAPQESSYREWIARVDASLPELDPLTELKYAAQTKE